MYHHSHFLATTLDFTSFFTMGFLGAAHFLYSLVVFGLDINLIQNSLAVKKCATHKNAIMKKDVKSKVATKKWL